MKKKTKTISRLELKIDARQIAAAEALRFAAVELERQAATLRRRADLLEGGGKAAAPTRTKPPAKKVAKRKAATAARKVTKKTARKASKKGKPAAR